MYNYLLYDISIYIGLSTFNLLIYDIVSYYSIITQSLEITDCLLKLIFIEILPQHASF